MLRKIKSEYDSLEKLKNYIQSKDASLICSIEIDQWVDTIVKASNMCLVVKKSATAGAKVVIVDPCVVEVLPIAPSTFINNFRRGISAVILNLIISSAQNKVANQIDEWIKEIEH